LSHGGKIGRSESNKECKKWEEGVKKKEKNHADLPLSHGKVGPKEAMNGFSSSL
jgi:hypothetical protein